MADEMGGSKMNWGWVVISIVVFLILQVILRVAIGIFGFITLGVGWLLFIFIKPLVYFIGGFLTGYFSPGETIKEPALGAVIVTVLGALFDYGIFGLGRIVWVIIASIVALVVAVIGAGMGEKLSRSGDI